MSAPKRIITAATLFAVLIALPFAATVRAAGAATPSQAVSVLLAAFTSHSTTLACNAVTGKLASCPATKRFRTQAKKASQQANAICRCQNTPTKVLVSAAKATGNHIPVFTQWYFGGKLAYTLTFIIVKTGATWRVDDEYCAGKPSTTIYKLPAGPCT